MIALIVLHELKEYIKSTKFLVGLVLTNTMIVVSVLINMSNYLTYNQNYIDSNNGVTNFIDEVSLYRPPNVLDIWVQGITSRSGVKAGVKNDEIPIRTTGEMGFISQNMNSQYTDILDVSFVIRFIMSLFVLFVTYDCISGEKERGTLKLMLSNSFSRHILLLGKYLGGLIIIIYSLLIAFIISILLVYIHPAITMSLTDLIRVGLIFGFSVVYLCVFFSLSLFLSTLINNSSKTLLILLEIWIVSMVIYPNVVMVLVKNYYPVISETEVSYKKNQILQSYAKELDAIDRADKDIATKSKTLRTKKTEENYLVEKERDASFDKQINAANYLSAFSPSVLYEKKMHQVALNGIEEYNEFMHDIYVYWQQNLKDSDYYVETASPDPPLFSYSPQSIRESISHVIPAFLTLFLCSTIFFVLAYVNFLRMDI